MYLFRGPDLTHNRGVQLWENVFGNQTSLCSDMRPVESCQVFCSKSGKTLRPPSPTGGGVHACMGALSFLSDALPILSNSCKWNFTIGDLCVRLLSLHILRFIRMVACTSYHCLVTQSCPTLLQPHGLQPTRLLCPWDSEVGHHVLLQGIFLTQESNPCLLTWQADSLPMSHQGRPACSSTSFLFTAKYYSIVWIYHILFIHHSLMGI